MRNSPSENFGIQEKSQEISVNLSELQKEFLQNALNILRSSPETEENIKNHFEENLNSALQNPENFQKILNSIDNNLHKQIEKISAQVENGEIYAEEWKNFAKNKIIEATQTKLEAAKKLQKTEE